MLNLFSRIEDVLVQIVRVVLLVFSVFVLLGMGLWLWDHYQPKKPQAVTASASTALDWKDAPYDLKYMLDETERDLSSLGNALPVEKRLADPALRPSFQKADGLLRGFVYKNPAERKRVEQENSSQGLTPLHPLLQGDVLPSPAEVNRQIKLREARENACCDSDAADAAAAAVDAEISAHRITLKREDLAIARAAAAAADAAVAAAAEADSELMLSEPVNLMAEINDRASAAEMEHGSGAYEAYVKGLPAALQQVLGNESLAAKLQQQPTQQIVNTLLINYTLAFDRTAQVLKGENPDQEKWQFSSVETAFTTMLIACLVMVIMVLVLIRMERHMRVMSQQDKTKP